MKFEVVATARDFVARHPNIGAILLECTNLAPFSHYIAQSIGLAVYDTVTMINSFQASLRPRAYPMF